MNTLSTTVGETIPPRPPSELSPPRGAGVGPSPARAAWYAPSRVAIESSQLTEFSRRFGERLGRSFKDHAELHQTSVAEFRSFWSVLLEWSALKFSGDAARVCIGDECETAVFFPDLRLNYAENVLTGRPAQPESFAVTSIQSGGGRRRITRAQLRQQVEMFAQALREQGLGEGDRVVAIMRNDVDAVITALAVSAVGASLACAAPEMGAEAIVERFAPLEPKMLLAHALPRSHDTGTPVTGRVAKVAAELASLAMIVTIDDAALPATTTVPVRTRSALTANHGAAKFVWRQFAFNQPLFIMASSGTTGRPKCIVHGAGGTLLEHTKEHRLHGDLRAGDRMYFQTSCAWMMWQWQLSALASCDEIVLYDGPVQDPRALWRIVHDERVTVFGTSPAYLKFSEDSGVEPGREFELGTLRAMMSTGAILYDSQYAWVRRQVGALPLQSISGGTDIIGCFVLGNPNLPVYAGESQCRSLGLDVQAAPIEGALAGGSAIGELICANPFPSRPLGFYGDSDGSRFHASYFSGVPGVWTHGDLIEFTPEGTARIHGRSDGVLNVRGIRIGPAEIYKLLREFKEVRDAMVVEQRVPEAFRDGRAVLFLVMAEGNVLDGPLAVRIRRRLAQALSAAHVPDVILTASDLPYTHSGKPSEAALTAVVNGMPLRNARALRNPACLDGVAALPALQPTPTSESAADVALARQDPVLYLRAVWERIFGFGPIGVDDDFFDMGGHSLMAARLVSEVGAALGRDLPVTTLLHAPTIRSLAEVVRDPSWAPTARLIPLRAGEGRPFFLIHSMAGTVVEMWAVLRALTSPRPVYGLQARGLEDGQEPHLRVQEMAAEYLEFVRSVQPHGPYALGGYSFGGLVAFEMANQLHRAGESVELVMVVDAQVDGRYLPARQQWQNLVRRFLERTEVFRALTDRQQKWSYLVAKGLVFVDRCRETLGLPPKHPELVGNIVFEADHSPVLRRLRGAMRLATRAYRPPVYQGRVVFVRPEQPGATDPLPVWRRAVRGELALETTPGDHYSLITGANAAALAAVLSRHLAPRANG